MFGKESVDKSVVENVWQATTTLADETKCWGFDSLPRKQQSSSGRENDVLLSVSNIMRVLENSPCKGCEDEGQGFNH